MLHRTSGVDHHHHPVTSRTTHPEVDHLAVSSHRTSSPDTRPSVVSHPSHPVNRRSSSSHRLEGHLEGRQTTTTNERSHHQMMARHSTHDHHNKHSMVLHHSRVDLGLLTSNSDQVVLEVRVVLVVQVVRAFTEAHLL